MTFLLTALLATFCLFPLITEAAPAEGQVTYHGYVVIDVYPENLEQLGYLRHMLNTDTKLDFWEQPKAVGQRVRFMVQGEYFDDSVTPELQSAGISFTVSDASVQDSIDAEKARIAMASRATYNFNIDNFNTLADIYKWLKKQKRACPNGLVCKRKRLGWTYEERKIFAFWISSDTSGLRSRKSIYIDSTTHAREWIAPATNLKLLNNFLTGWTSGDPVVTALLNKYKWHFVIVVNPDGYEYTWTTERYWRKNRAPNANSSCIGVDLNRNFDYMWSLQGVSLNPCGSTYCGPSGNSELETKAITKYITNIAGSDGSKLLAMVTLHSYGKFWFIPFGYTNNFLAPPNGICQRAPHIADLEMVTDAACDAILAQSGTEWRCGNPCELLYPTTGSTDDWSIGVANVKYAFNPELRGNGFVVPATEIEPSFQEIWAALKAMVNTIEAIEGI